MLTISKYLKSLGVFPSLSLTGKLFVMTLVITSAAGIILDVSHSRRFSEYFAHHNETTIKAATHQAHQTLVVGFDRLSGYGQLLAGHGVLQAYIHSQAQQPYSSYPNTSINNWRPVWWPASLREEYMPRIDIALLLSVDGKLIEGFQATNTIPENELKSWVSNRSNWVTEQRGVATVGREMLVYSSHAVTGNNGITQARLVLATDLGHYLASLNEIGRSTDIGFALARGDNKQLLAATDNISNSRNYALSPDLLHSINMAPVLSGSNVKLLAFQSAGSGTSLAEFVLLLDREQRAVVCAIAVVLILILASWTGNRVKRMSDLIQQFAERFGMTLPTSGKGDQLEVLERQFQRFSEEVIAENTALEFQAMHDPLTGLPNRMLLQDRLEHSLAQSLREEKDMAFLLMDLDRFKEINDTLGHHIGDRLLQEVAKRLSEVLRKSDTVARLGGDEFAVLLPSTSRSQCKLICRKIVQAIERPITIDTLCLRAAVSIGAAVCPEQGEDSTTLMQRADVAMYTAKRGGLGFSFYRHQQDEHSISRLSLVGELKDAVEQNQLELCYQPLVDIKTGRISTAEALVRWNHPEMGQIVPDEFIPLAEQSGVIRDLTMWVFDRALKQWSEWHQAGIELQLSLNMSVRVLQDKELPAKVGKLIERHGITPGWITLEVTESAVMSDPVTARRVMRRLADMGLQLSIDDFGTGYSSLAYLKQLPVNAVKIDKSFVTQMAVNENDAVIVRATIDLAHNLGLKVVAEGVETEEAWDLLEMLGCDLAQGFLIRRPIGAGELARWLASQRWKTERWAEQRLIEAPV